MRWIWTHSVCSNYQCVQCHIKYCDWRNLFLSKSKENGTFKTILAISDIYQ